MALFNHPVAGACAAMSNAVPPSREGERSVAELTILLPQLLANALQHRDAAHGRSSQPHVCCRKCEISPHHAECGLWTFGRPFKARHAHVGAGRGSWRVGGDHMPAVACVRDHRWVGLSRYGRVVVDGAWRVHGGSAADVPRPGGRVDVWTCVLRCATAGPSSVASYASTAPPVGCEGKFDSER